MALIKCKECGCEISESALSCPKCGFELEKTKFCKYCGEKIPYDAIICVKCGRQIENTKENSQININNISNNPLYSDKEMYSKKRVDKIVALLLCIFLGEFGIHKFYEGKIGMGVLYLLTFGLFGIGWLVDIFIIAFKPNPYYV